MGSMKKITFTRGYLAGIWFSVQESASDVTISVLAVGKRRYIIFCSTNSRLPAEDKPLKKTIFNVNLQKHCINFADHCNFYNFYNSHVIIS